MSAMLSGIIGAVGGIITPIIQHKHKIEEENMRHSHEIERLKIQTDLQAKLAEQRAREEIVALELAQIESSKDIAVSDNQLMAQSYKAFRSRNGFSSFITSAVRPVITMAFVFLYIKVINKVLQLFFVSDLSVDAMERIAQVSIISSFIDIVAGVIGFWFGNRALRKK